jgi:hypothetical protein
MDALSDLSKEELISYAKLLLSGAIDRLDMDMPEEACWRVANALGTLATITADSPNIVAGIGTKTSLGYKLELSDDDT